MRFVRPGVLGFLCGASLAAGAANIIDNAALTTGTDGHNWAAYGRTFDETHYSPLAEINRDTVPRLNLAWTLDLDVTNNLSTPLAVEGVIYVASGYSFVHAVDAKTGHLLWRYDPEVAKVVGNKLRTGWGIRGLASPGCCQRWRVTGCAPAIPAPPAPVRWGSRGLSRWCADTLAPVHLWWRNVDRGCASTRARVGRLCPCLWREFRCGRTTLLRWR